MLSLRASLAPVLPRFASAATALTLAGCSLMHHGAAQGDAGAADSGVAVAVIEAGALPPVVPENVNQVGRFPDELSLNDTAAKIADPNVSARNAVPGGVLVATLRLGTPVTQVAKHDTFILCLFPDPKNPARTLEGWVAEQAFVPGPTVPSKTVCATGMTRLMIDEQDFCGRVCKNDSDCQSGQVCTGKASLLANGRTGAEVTTCTIPLSGGAPAGGATSNAGKVVPGVQTPPLPGNVCPATFVLAGDKLCHKDCTRAPCPLGAKCARGLGAAVCEAE
jgi:hypothetical protein